MDWKAQIDRWGLSIYCQRCGAKGKFFPNAHGHRWRLREVTCSRTVSDGETICGGRFRSRPRDSVSRDWPRCAIPFEVPQLDLFERRARHGR